MLPHNFGLSVQVVRLFVCRSIKHEAFEVRQYYDD